MSLLSLQLAGCGASSEPASPTASGPAEAPEPGPAAEAPGSDKPDPAAPARSVLDDLPDDVVAALEQPDATGSFVIEAWREEGQILDRCTGEANAVDRPDELVGVARCSFQGALQEFGTTEGKFRVPAGSTAGLFDASPAPVVAPVELVVDGATRRLTFQGSVAFEDGEGLSFAGRIELQPAAGGG